ncbi:helix-turn-helix domain-containing protein [Quadrisphaera sp. INWT6]|nr:helix-turn-helix domain-containing protein [Quadrisphaera sp. INWT6]
MSGLLDIGGVGRTSARGRSNGVRAARTALGITQADLAAAAGVTRQTVVAVEAGDYAPSVYLALALAARLGRSVEELFGQDEAAAAGAAAGGERR